MGGGGEGDGGEVGKWGGGGGWEEGRRGEDGEGTYTEANLNHANNLQAESFTLLQHRTHGTAAVLSWLGRCVVAA